MNKLINVNIGGIIFQIDELAYKKLDGYLNAIKNKYGHTADGDEIINDIEARIAELFSEKLKGTSGAIFEKDVDDIIETMGQPDDYETHEQAQHTNQTGPTNSDSGYGYKRFYRDGDQRVLGGVCSGIAAYFSIDPVIVRIIFIITFFAFGTGFLLYVVLWIVIPEAKTTAEKLEMRGEKVNIDTIEKKIKDEAGHFNKRMKDFGNDVKQTFSGERMEKTKKNAGDFIESIVHSLKPIVQSIAKLFAAIILLICLAIVAALGIELISNWGNKFSDIQFLSKHVTDGGKQAWILVSCALSLIIIPLIGLIFTCIKYLAGVKKKTKFISLSLGFLWTICLIVVIYLGISIGRNFKYEATTSNKMLMPQPSGVLSVQINTDDESIQDDTNGFWGNHEGKKWGIIIAENNDINQVDIEIEKSMDSDYVIIINKNARGYSKENAKKNAGDFNYTISSAGNSISIPSYIQLKDNEAFRNQTVHIIIRIPVGKYVQLNKNMEIYLNHNEYISGLNDVSLYNTKLEMTAAGLRPSN